MGIHHAKTKKAEKMGVILTETEDGLISAHWASHNVLITGRNVTAVETEIQAAIAIKNMEPEIGLVGCALDDDQEVRHFWVTSGDKTWGDGPVLLSIVHSNLVAGNTEWTEASEHQPVDVARSAEGVALDGAIAYKEGTPAGDNPYFPKSDEDEDDAALIALAEEWDAAWDDAADEAEDDKSDGGSVVKSTYRALYAEQGHPNHCGDWLAETLNALCQTNKGIDLARFEAICAANGVDLSKYNRETRGWEGRLRMTGRNMLAKKIYNAGGILKTPIEGADPEYKAPAQWMERQRYKMPKAEQAKPIPEASEAE
jgi:hypothetical protein